MVQFNQKYRTSDGRLVGDIDVASKEAIIEVTLRKDAKLGQLKKYDHRYRHIMNPDNKSIVLYAPNYRHGAAMEILRNGYRWVQGTGELRTALDRIHKWRGIEMEQAVIFTRRLIQRDEFQKLMIQFGGLVISDNEYAFNLQGAEFTVMLDEDSLHEQDDDSLQPIKAKIGGKPKSCLSVFCTHGVMLEDMRSFLVRLTAELKGAVDIDDLGVFDGNDIESKEF